MADDPEERPNVSLNYCSTRAAIVDALNRCKKWQVLQREEFINKQNLESQRILQFSGESQAKIEQLLKNAYPKDPIPKDEPKETVPEISDCSSISLANDLDNCSTLQESSLTGHLQRCFDDSSKSSSFAGENKIPSIPEKLPVFSELRNPQFSEKNPGETENQLINNNNNKPKRPFLKKGSGLLRYRPKASTNFQTANKKVLSKENNPSVKKAQLPQRTLKLKPAIRKTDVPVEHVKHIRFNITGCNDDSDNKDLSENDLSPVSEIGRNEEVSSDKRSKSSPLSSSSTELDSLSPQKNTLDALNSGSESLSLSAEGKELEEFELLENCTQNSSFNSDSSVVQRILHGESTKIPGKIPSQNYSTKQASENVLPALKEILKNPSSENSNFREKIGFNKYNEEIQAKKQTIEKTISDINPRIQSLEKEIYNCPKENLEDDGMNERCSTPLEDVSFSRNLSTVPECDSNEESTSPDAFVSNQNEAKSPFACSCCNADGNLKDLVSSEDYVQNISEEEEEFAREEAPEVEQISDGKSKIREKLLQLQKEIDTYQELNAKVLAISKERDATVRKLQKERDEFNKFKESEKMKFEAEMKKERQQMRREKETFMRNKNFPTKKEREELKVLRQEVEKLQDKLKQQEIKYRNDSRRWKNRLEAAETERNSLKMECLQLQEQCQDLVVSLKARLKKKSEIQSSDEGDTSKHVENSPINSKDAETQTKKDESYLNVSKNAYQAMPKSSDVRNENSNEIINLVPVNEKSEIEINNDTVGIHEIKSFKGGCFLPPKDNTISPNNELESVEKGIPDVNLSTISVSREIEIKETKYGQKVERIHPSGEREVIFSNGTRKVTSADGKIKRFFFFNGDTKEIFPDKREIYKYAKGVTETLFPDGLIVREYLNGQVEHQYPDGGNEIKFPDGVIRTKYPDGSEVIQAADGTKVKLNLDGTRCTEYPNGKKEINTDTYKKIEFVDGSSKTFYATGRVETRFSDGRIKIKDKDGKVIFDTKYMLTGIE